MRFFHGLFFLILLSSGSVQSQKKELSEIFKVCDKVQDESSQNECSKMIGEKGELFISDWKNSQSFIKKRINNQLFLDGLLFGISQMGDKSKPLLINLIKFNEKNIYVSVLKKYGALPSGKEVNKALLDGLNSSDEDIQKMILEFILREKVVEAKGRISNFLKSKSMETKLLAVLAIKEIRDKSAVKYLVEAYQTEPKSTSSLSLQLRLEILKLLGLLGDEWVIPTIIDSLKYQDEKETSKKILVSFGIKAVPYLVFVIKSRDFERTDIAYQCLLEIGEEASREMIKLLRHPYEDVRIIAIDFFRLKKPESGLQPLIELYKSKGFHPAEKLLSLIGLYPIEGIKNLIKEELDNPSDSVRITALDIIKNHRDLSFEKKILSIAEDDPSIEVRIKAVDVIFKLRVTSAIPLFLRMSQYEKKDVSSRVIKTLGYIGGTNLLFFLKELINSKEKEIRDAVDLASAIISGCIKPDRWNRDETKYKHFELKKEKFVIIENEKYFYFLSGKKGEGIILIPGGPLWGGSSFYPWLNELSDEKRLIYFEPSRISLKSQINPLNAEAMAIEEIRKSLKMDRFFIIAHDFGVIPSLSYLKEYTLKEIITPKIWFPKTRAIPPKKQPQNVKGLILINPVVPLRQKWDEAEGAILNKLKEPYISELNNLVKNQEDFSPDAFNHYYYKLLRNAFVTENEDTLILGNIFEDMVKREGYLSQIGFFDLTPQLEKFKGNILVLWSDGTYIPQEQKKYYQDIIKKRGKSAKFIELKGCGHFPQITCMKKLIETIEDFID